MPEYRCPNCGHVVTLIIIFAQPDIICPFCSQAFNPNAARARYRLQTSGARKNSWIARYRSSSHRAGWTRRSRELSIRMRNSLIKKSRHGG